jgi:hypothetical protein
MNEYLQTRLDELKDNQCYLLNEEIQHDGRVSYISGTSCNRWDEYCKDFDLHEKSH